MRETAGRSGISAAPRPGARPGLAGDEAVRRSSLGVAAALLVQYGLGLWVSLYVTVPARDQGGGVLAAVGRALAHGPAALAVHAGLGLLLLLGSVILVVRAAAARAGFFVVTTTVSLIAVLAAAGAGAAFVNSGADSASLTMGLFTAVALLAQVINLFRLSAPAPARDRPAWSAAQSSHTPGRAQPPASLSHRRRTGRPRGHSSGTRRPGSGRSRPREALRPGS